MGVAQLAGQVNGHTTAHGMAVNYPLRRAWFAPYQLGPGQAGIGQNSLLGRGDGRALAPATVVQRQNGETGLAQRFDLVLVALQIAESAMQVKQRGGLRVGLW